MSSLEKNLLTLVIPDPGLREYSGHHPATIKAIIASNLFSNGSLKLEVYAHRDCRIGFIDAVKSERLEINPYFITEYYQYFYQSPSVYLSQQYIQTLSKEYKQLLQIYYRRPKEETVLFWFHTLTWHHAYALALAMESIETKNSRNIKFSIGLMYSPFKKESTGQIDRRHQMYNEIAFRFLEKQQNTTFFAADAQLQRAYSNILKGSINGIQPCALVNVTNTLPIVKAEKNKVILFVGDAKPNKGFLKLPELVTYILSQEVSKSLNFVVHCTLDTNRVDLLSTLKYLKELTHKFPHFKVIDKFLSHDDLQLLMYDAKAILFNYDEAIYNNQSSGVLWIAAFFKVRVLSLTSTWVEKEAHRLNSYYRKVNKENLLKTMLEKHEPSNDNFDNIEEECNSYRNQLFSDLGTWLKAQIR